MAAMSSPHEILVKLERDYRIAMSKYERAELPTETIVGVKMVAAADQRIQAEKRVLKEKMEKIDYLIRLQVDPEWTPHHLTPLHERAPRRRGSISKEAYKVLRAATEPLSTREVALLAAPALGVDPADSRAISRISAAIATSLNDRHDEDAVERLDGRPIRWRARSRPKWVPTNVPVAYASAPLDRASG